jgi:REP element-mobilizing transposase RayT
MARPLRIEFPKAWYHIMNRGRREAVFLSPRDYEAFIKVLQEAADFWNLKISAYCLMPNHYHLLVHTPDGNLSRCMRHINGVYTQRFNRQHKKDGQLFRGRYKAIIVEEDNHLLEVLRYIHNNPLRAGLVEKLVDFKWSSHQGYTSTTKKWAWLYKDFLLSMLSEKKRRRKAAYLSFVGQKEPESIAHFYSLKNLPSFLGSDTFKEWIKEKYQHLTFHEEIPESRQLAPSAEQVIEFVCAHFQVTRNQLDTSKRGRENLPRNVAIYLVRKYCRETMNRIGRYFEIDRSSTVSSVINRIKARKDKDLSLQKHLDKIAMKLDKSQERT